MPSGLTVDDRLATDDAAILEQRHWRCDDGTAMLRVLVGCLEGRFYLDGLYGAGSGGLVVG